MLSKAAKCIASPGDYARKLGDGSIELLGHGSVCINSGGEKIYPEEVETLLKGHPDIYDVVAVGTAHSRFGQQVTAVVQQRTGHKAPDLANLCEFCRGQIADYKLPKAVIHVDQVPRTAVGKSEYRNILALAKERLASSGNS